MKLFKKRYPKGTFKNQKSDGRYIDKNYYENLKVLAKSIIRDMTFLGICFSSTLEVGTGKTVFMTQTGEVWSHLIKKLHGIKTGFKIKNIVFRPKDLIERAFQVPQYSCVLVDEWEDAHYWSELGMTLRQFFRKCRQLNLFILLVIPNFFQLPMNYALGRSIFAVDVKFSGEFERGYFDFYDFEAKRQLYIKGKKSHNYKVVKPSFQGRFFVGYGVDEQAYLKQKAIDFKRLEEEEIKIQRPDLIAYNEKIQVIRKLYDQKDLIAKKGFKTKTIAQIFEIPNRTIEQWMTNAKKRASPPPTTPRGYTKKIIEKKGKKKEGRTINTNRSKTNEKD